MIFTVSVSPSLSTAIFVDVSCFGFRFPSFAISGTFLFVILPCFAVFSLRRLTKTVAVSLDSPADICFFCDSLITIFSRLGVSLSSSSSAFLRLCSTSTVSTRSPLSPLLFGILLPMTLFSVLSSLVLTTMRSFPSPFLSDSSSTWMTRTSLSPPLLLGLGVFIELRSSFSFRPPGLSRMVWVLTTGVFILPCSFSGGWSSVTGKSLLLLLLLPFSCSMTLMCSSCMSSSLSLSPGFTSR